MRRFRSQAWSLFLAVLMVLTVLVPTGAVQAFDPATITDDEAVVMLQSYNIVRGDPSGNLRLSEPITRAQAATVFVRALGQEQLAQLLRDTRVFEDTVGHWAAGEIAMAQRLNLMKGDGQYFRPDDNITYAELMTVMLRMIGQEPAGPWDPVAIMKKAEELGIAPASIDVTLLAGVPAMRGKVFRSLAVTMMLPTADGKSLLQKHIDKTPPELIVDEVPERAASERITITGETTGARAVLVNGTEATMTGGRFQAEVNLSGGANEIVVEAVDYAGNKATETFTVTVGGDPVRIEVTGPAQVEPNETVTITATAYDGSGFALPASAVSAEVLGNLGTYNAATGEFKAGSTAGTATIRFTAGDVTEEFTLAVLGLAPDAASMRIQAESGTNTFTMNKSQKVVVEVLDANGQPIPYDTGRTITLRASSDSVTISPSSAKTQAGKASFTVTAAEAGTFTLSASAGGVAGASESFTAATSTRIVLTATPSTIVANGSDATVIRAELQDENGNPVINRTDSDITLKLSTSGAAGSLGNSFVIIPKGNSSSANYDGQFIALYEHGTAIVSGTVTSDHDYTVVDARISLQQLVIGRPSRLEVLGGSGIQDPGDPVTLTIRVTDQNGNQITEGSYAFQVRVTTSNPADNNGAGLPDGVTLSLGDTALQPLEGSDIVARTEGGIARITVSYDKSGIVTITPIGVRSTNSAYDVDGDLDDAASTTGWTVQERKLTYDDVAGSTTDLELVWDLPHLKLTDQPYAILPADGNTSAKLRVYLLDQWGGRRPSGDGTVTIEQTGGGTRSSDTAQIKDGVAELTVVANRNVDDQDTYTVTYVDAKNGTITEQTFAQVRQNPAYPPTIWSLYSESGNTERIEVGDDYMEIVLSDTPSEYGIVKVYTSRGQLIHTSDVMDLAGNPVVQVPKSALPTGTESYKVRINTGYGDSSYSQLSNPIANARPITMDISSVRYDAVNGTLKVYASGVTDSYGGRINPEYLFLRKGGEADYPLAGADCTVSRGYFTCDVSYLGLTADNFRGDWYLVAEDGWFVRQDRGDSAQADENLSNNYVTPLAYIEWAAIDYEAGKITLYGENLNQGYIYPAHLKVVGDTTVALSASTSTRVSATRDDEVTLTIPSDVMDTIEGFTVGTVTLDAEAGWLVSSTGEANAEILSLDVLAMVKVGRAAYDPDSDTLTIYGSGFTGGTVKPANLVITDRSGTEVVSLGSATSIDVLNDGTIEIVLDAITAGTLETKDADGRYEYDGQVYLGSSLPDVENGNFTDSWFTVNGRLGAPLRDYTYLLNW